MRSEASSSSGEAGAYLAINPSPVCVITRFRARSILGIFALFSLYRSVRNANTRREGLLSAKFLLEDWRTCLTLSIWSGDSAILQFNRGIEHVHAANVSFGIVEWLEKPAIWSGRLRLERISRFNHEWAELSSLLEESR